MKTISFNKSKKVLKTVAIFILQILFISCSTSDDVEEINRSFIEILDRNFEAFLVDQGIDSDGIINQRISKNDAIQTTKLDLNSSTFGDIENLSGIEGFTNLTTLNAARHRLYEIDLRSNSKLDTLTLEANYLTRIDLSKNINLKMVNISFNDLTAVDGISKLTQLKTLNLSGNLFQEITISNPTLELLSMTDNELKSMNISNANSLKSLLLNRNMIQDLDISLNTKLETLIISGNEITTIDLSQNEKLVYFYASNNELTQLDVSNNLNLVDLRVNRNNSLSCIKIGDNQSIPNLVLSNNQVVSSTCN